jgi:hypothetical protein
MTFKPCDNVGKAIGSCRIKQNHDGHSLVNGLSLLTILGKLHAHAPSKKIMKAIFSPDAYFSIFFLAYPSFIRAKLILLPELED